MRFPMLRCGLVLGCVASIGLSGVAAADPGDLDHTFGGDGLVNVSGHLGLRESSLAPAPQNGLWLAGSDTTPCCAEDTTAAITRLRSNGSLDNGFGDGGHVFYSYSDDGPAPVTAGWDPEALSDGGVQIAGDWRANNWEGEGPTRSYVARFDANGDVVDSFGEHGAVSARYHAFELTAVAADQSLFGCEHLAHKVVVRAYLPDGTRDAQFSRNGKASVHIADLTAYRRMVGCSAVDGGGVEFATATSDALTSKLRVVRLMADGTKDLGYGHKGEAVVEIPGLHRVLHAAFDADGSGRFSGVMQVGADWYPAVFALNAAGERDDTYGGGDAVALIEFEKLIHQDAAYVSVASDGTVALSGEIKHGGGNDDPYVVRITPDGSLDQTFGEGGLATGYLDLTDATDVVFDGTGRIVSANSDNAVTTVTVARFQR